MPSLSQERVQDFDYNLKLELVLALISRSGVKVLNLSLLESVTNKIRSYKPRNAEHKDYLASPCFLVPSKECVVTVVQFLETLGCGYIESAEQSRTAEQNKISKLTVKLQLISTEHDCRM